MPKNTNSASRLHALFVAAQGGDQNIAAYQVWKTVFNIEKTDHHQSLMAVMEELLWTQEEIEILRTHMQKRDFSLSVYSAYIDHLQNAIQPLSLGTTWGSTLQNYLKPEVMGFLAITAEMLPDEEIKVPEQEIVSINNLVIELEALVGAGGLPGRLQAIIVHHIDLIHKALERYPITGVRALRDAAWSAAGELLQAKNDLAQNDENFKQSLEVQKLEELWEKVNVVLDVTIKVGTLYELGNTAYKLIN